MTELDQARARRDREQQLMFLHKHAALPLPPALARVANGPTGQIIRGIIEAIGPVLADLERRVERLERDLERRQWLETQRRRREERERRG